MIIDGRAIAKELEGGLKEKFISQSTRLDIILVGDDAPSRQFVNLKKKFGSRMGVEVRVHEYDDEVLFEDLAALIARLNADERTDGIILQLPLPAHLRADDLINLIDPHKDVDALGKEARVLPPVAAAVAEILTANNIAVAGKKAVVVGKGRLVGRPVAVWLSQEGAEVTVIDSKTENAEEILKEADIIVTGIGQPHFIKPEMIKDGAVLIDAGSSESAGQVVGDADPACAPKCSLFTPVPGGVGPITVAKLFENLYQLISG